MKLLLGILVILGLPACGTLGGGADYKYSRVDKNGASCTIEVGSMRSLQGVGVTIGKDCQMQANAEAATPNAAMVHVLKGLVDKLPSAALFPTPTPQ